MLTMHVGTLKRAWLFFGLALLSDAKEERNWLNSSFQHMQQVESYLKTINAIYYVYQGTKKTDPMKINEKECKGCTFLCPYMRVRAQETTQHGYKSTWVTRGNSRGFSVLQDQYSLVIQKSDNYSTYNYFNVMVRDILQMTPHKACGVRGQSSVTGAKITGPSFQIIGGEDAEPEKFPWQISLQYIVPPGNNLGHGCGGSIINKQYVLTAAHCVDRVAPNSRLVIVGEYNLNQTDPLERKVAVSSITIHPKYKTGGVMYDYALLKLETPLDFSGADKGLMPICLPTKNQGFANQTCTASGWGFTKPSKRGVLPQILQKVDLHIVSLEECRKAYGHYTVMEDCMICAGFKEGRKSTCYGDSGGPLQCVYNRRSLRTGRGHIVQ